MLKKRNKNFYVLIFIIFLLNIILSITFNLTNYRDELKIKNVIQLELEKNISEESLANIEKKVLEIKGVSKTKFYSSKEALENINKNLKIAIDSKDNPITDILICYLNSDVVDLNKVLPQFKEIKEVNSVHYNEDIFNKNKKIFLDMKLIVLASWVMFILPLALTFFSLFRGMIHNHSVYYYFHSKNVERSVTKAWRVSFLPMTISIIFGAGISFLMYIFLYKGILKGELIAGEEMLKIFIKVNSVIFFISAFLSKKLLKKA